MNIREAHEKDAAVIVMLIQQLADGIDETSPLTDEYAARYLSVQGSQVLLAEIEGQTVGLLSYSIRPDLYHAGICCMIEELVVFDEKRSLGIGGALLESLLGRAQDAGWAEVSVSVMPGNQGALRFYQQHGLLDEAVLLEKHLTG